MKKALIADDTKNIRILLSTCLELNGYTVLTASNGKEALDLFLNQHIDLAFLDIKMPEVSGTEVLRKVRASNIMTPVVMMTAFATIKNAVECTKLGAVAYLQKPFTADKVKLVLGDLESYSTLSSEYIGDLIQSSKFLLEEANFDEAYDLLKKALSINPCCGEIYALLGLLFEKKGDLLQATRFYSMAKQFDY